MRAVLPQARQPTGNSLEPSRAPAWTVMSGDIRVRLGRAQAGDRGALSPRPDPQPPRLHATRNECCQGGGGGSHPLPVLHWALGPHCPHPCKVERGTVPAQARSVSQAELRPSHPRSWVAPRPEIPGSPPDLPSRPASLPGAWTPDLLLLGSFPSALINSRMQTLTFSSTPIRPPSRPLGPHSPSSYQAAQV